MVTEKLFTKLMLTLSTISFTIGLVLIIKDLNSKPGGIQTKDILELGGFCFALLSLFYGNVIYQLARIGQLGRHKAYIEPSTAVLEDAYENTAPPTVTILIPCYKEEISVVMQTVLSAAFAEYPNRRITILIDDPPDCSGKDYKSLVAMRELIATIDLFFKTKAHIFASEAKGFEIRLRRGVFSVEGELDRLRALYERAADFVEEMGRSYQKKSSSTFAHSDELFGREVLQRIASSHRERRFYLQSQRVDSKRIMNEYLRLASLFAVPISAFERKLFTNLSHAPNKAMNLNSYIGLIGRRLAGAKADDGLLWLIDADEDADLIVPPTKYILTIDADSVILPDYMLKLVALMEADEGLAVAQTPYSAYRNPPTVLERVAGATTDIQYFVHQGFTAFNATFWVGANALLRHVALRDILVMQEERGHQVPVFIQDDTVIEDTGSTIDLAARGWRLYNHPQRLAYSATPPDFGSLVIQRRRWANGGLIIFPSLLRLAFGTGKARASLIEALIRSHYLLSPALANIGLLMLLLIPFGAEFANPFLVLAASPYYLLYGQDLKRAGYQWRDLLRHYALTLLLIPVNLAGVFGSCKQIMTGRKTPFGRTPKVSGRTATPLTHIFFIYLLSATAAASAVLNLTAGNYLFFFFCSINAAFLLYAQKCLIGWREALDDICAYVRGWRHAPPPMKASLREPMGIADAKFGSFENARKLEAVHSSSVSSSQTG
ncbi:MAG: hypothetical protein JWL62_3881 [Hyphomicrobiales bacterium]|nr:hypothetical protein [Hyphomicrobiales bacterium]